MKKSSKILILIMVFIVGFIPFVASIISVICISSYLLMKEELIKLEDKNKNILELLNLTNEKNTLDLNLFHEREKELKSTSSSYKDKLDELNFKHQKNIDELILANQKITDYENKIIHLEEKLDASTRDYKNKLNELNLKYEKSTQNLNLANQKISQLEHLKIDVSLNESNENKIINLDGKLGTKIDDSCSEQINKIHKIKKKEKQQDIDKKNYIVFDIETTGLSPSYNEITEIGALKIIDGKPAAEFNMLVKPKNKIPAKITKITGITDEMVKDADTIEIVLPKFIEFIEDLPLVAHNIEFDYSFIAENYMKIYDKIFKRRKYCTMKIYREWHKKVFGEKPKSAKLKDVASCLGISQESSHRAMADTITTYNAYKAML